ncbi:MAG: MFS transporter [Leptonema sp. (in: bacteria)]
MENKRTTLVLFIMIILDFIGFSLIFPLVPDLLIFYFSNPIYTLDRILINTFKNINQYFTNYKIENLILLMGTLLGSMYSFLQFLFSPFWGRLSDRVGRKKALLLTNLGIAISYLIWLFSFSFSFFILSRILNGIMAGNLGVISAYFSDVSKEENRTKSMGILGMGIGLGFIFGPVFGGIFYYSGKILFQKFPILKEIYHPFYLCSLGSFLLSTISVILNVLFLQEEKQSKKTEQKISFFSMKSHLKKITFFNFIYMLVFTSFEFTFTFYYKFKFLLNPTQIGFVFLYMGAFVALSQGIVPRYLSSKISEIRMIQTGTFLISFTFVFQIFTNNLVLSLLGLVPIALGNSLVQPAIYSYASKISDQNHIGYILGSLRSMASFSRAISPIMGGIIYWLYGYQIAYSIFFIIVLIIFLISISIWKNYN